MLNTFISQVHVRDSTGPPALFFLHRVSLATQDSFVCAHKYCRIVFSDFVQKGGVVITDVFIGIAVTLSHHVGQYI